MSQTTIRGPAHLPDAMLRRSLEASVGPDTAASALQRAGHEAGDAIFEALRDAVLRDALRGEEILPNVVAPEDAPPTNALAALDESEFWKRLSALFAERGWGELLFSEVHAGIGALESSDWAEADPSAAALRPSCHFTTGLLANLLGRVAESEVGVLEVECRSRGDLHCRFLFGGRSALEHLYTGIRAGAEVAEAIGRLG